MDDSIIQGRRDAQRLQERDDAALLDQRTQREPVCIDAGPVAVRVVTPPPAAMQYDAGRCTAIRPTVSSGEIVPLSSNRGSTSVEPSNTIQHRAAMRLMQREAGLQPVTHRPRSQSPPPVPQFGADSLQARAARRLALRNHPYGRE